MRTRALALRIALLLEEYSQDEIAAAIRLLKSHADVSSLLSFMKDPSPKKEKLSGKRVRAVEAPASKVLLQLRDVEPRKYELLREFEAMLRAGTALPTFDDLKRFGERISKEFVLRKSRNESINPLLLVLLSRPVEEIEELLRLAKTTDASPGEDQYLRLARFLMKGYPN